MADVSIADIKALRERTGAGMVDSKNALVEAEGDIEKAIELLRKKGQSRLAKREGNTTSEGLVAAVEDGGTATLIELSCETDFVAKGEKFIALAEKVLTAVAAARASTVEEGLAAPVEGAGTVSELIAGEAGVINEKIELRKVVSLSGEHFSIYLHRTSQDLPPQLGVVVAYSGDDAETARSIAQHISFAAPLYLSRDEVPDDAVANERRIVEEISRNEGKPEAALPKIIEGRLGAFFKQSVLGEQDYARDNKVSVAKVLHDAKLTVTAFARFRVGA